MLDQIQHLAGRRATFAFETTLASRSLAPWIADLRAAGYAFDPLFFWIPSADAAVSRVAKRVRSGGHHVPEETVRRRFERGLANFFQLYKPLADHWRFYDNSAESGPRIVALGDESIGIMVVDDFLWDELSRRYCREPEAEGD
jgi:predicted ABC-type ATPase